MYLAYEKGLGTKEGKNHALKLLKHCVLEIMKLFKCYLLKSSSIKWIYQWLKAAKKTESRDCYKTLSLLMNCRRDF